MDVISHTDDETAQNTIDETEQADLWDVIQQRVLETDSQQVNGQHEIGFDLTYLPVHDCYRAAIHGVPGHAGTEALGIEFLYPELPTSLSLTKGNSYTLTAEEFTCKARLARVDTDDPSVTAWFVDGEMCGDMSQSVDYPEQEDDATIQILF